MLQRQMARKLTAALNIPISPKSTRKLQQTRYKPASSRCEHDLLRRRGEVQTSSGHKHHPRRRQAPERIDMPALLFTRPRCEASASVTGGLRCAPDTGPNVRIRVTSAEPVAIVFASRAIATFPPESRSPMIPEPPMAAKGKQCR